MILGRILSETRGDLEYAFTRVRARLRPTRRAGTKMPAERVLELARLEERVLLSASPVGAELLVNESSSGIQHDAAVATDGSGETVDAWASDNAGSSDIFARRHDPYGTAQGGDSAVNSTAAGSQTEASVVMDADGDLVADWTNEVSAAVAQEDDPQLSVRRELVFLDGSIQDYEQLLNDLWAGGRDGRHSDVVVLDGARDGIEQIGQALDAYRGLDAVHFVTHGSDGAVKLGNSRLTSVSLGAHSGDIARWGDALGPDGDLLFYGCDLAASADGIALIDAISALTGADVAASIDPTGHALLGGDWELEYTTGSIESAGALGLNFQGNWRHVLSSAPNVGPTNTVPGPQATPQNTPLEFSASNGNQISTSDPDAGLNPAQVTLTATNGNVTLNLPGGVSSPTGTEVRVNSTTSGTQIEASVARASDGRYVVVWSGSGNGSGTPDSAGIYAQLYDADGDPVSGEFRVNETVANIQDNPDVAMDQKGNFVVTWTSNVGGGVLDVFARRFDSSGADLGGEFRVNTYVAGNQERPAIAMAANGDFVVVWESNGQDGKGTGVYGQRFLANGATAGGEFQVNTYWDRDQNFADVAMAGDGDFVVVWQSEGQDHPSEPAKRGIYLQRYDAAGAAHGGEFLVNTVIDDEQTKPAIGMDTAGNFVVAWTSKKLDANALGVFGQRFDSDGIAVGVEFLINTTQASDQRIAALAMAPNGEFAVVWESVNQDNPGDMLTGVYLQQFDRDANPVGGERLVNTTVAGIQQAPAVAMDADGDFVVAWNGNGTGDTAGVFARTYENDDELTFTVGDGVADTTMTFTEDLDHVRKVLDGLIFTPSAGFTGLARLTITVNDLGNSGLGGPQQDSDTVDITVFAPAMVVGPINDTDGAANAVDENAANGSSVGITAFATDPDAGDTVTYSLDDSAGGRFTIAAAAGVVTVADGTLLDYEAATSHNITVRAASSDTSFSTRAFTIAVLPLNDNLPVFTSSPTPSINENQTIVQTLTATDADLPAQAIAFAIAGGPDAAKFAINGANQLVFVMAPDFESPADSGGDNVYEVQVTANDGNGGLTPRLISVTVNDVAEGNVLVVDTTLDIVDGDVTSIATLLADRGLDRRVSLREAIWAANNTPNGATPDEIRFNIPDLDAGHLYYRDNGIAGSLPLPVVTVLDDASIGDFDPDYPHAAHSWFRIDLNPTAPELDITDAVIIDGYSQAGATQNTLSIGHNANLRIELTSIGPDGNRGIHIAAGGAGSMIRGLAINRFDDAGILTDPAADGVTIQGNYLGTNITGTIDLGNGDAGIQLQSSNNHVGGPNLEDRNVISGNDSRGVVTFSLGPIETGNVVENNYIGVDASGLRGLGNTTAGVLVGNQDGMQIRGNVISGNFGDGVWLRAGSTHLNTVIQGNLIGVGADGAAVLGNTDEGIQIDSGSLNTTIGGTLAGQANTVAWNWGDGVVMLGGTGTSIRGNSIFGNGELGIDIIGVNGPDVYDWMDTDAGPNDRQNYPVLSDAIIGGSDIAISGNLNTTPSTAGILIDFYWTYGDPSGYGEGRYYLGSTTVNTDASGNASFGVLFLGASVPVGGKVTATATDPAGNTSEFGLNVAAKTANTQPAITSNATPTIDENQAVVYKLTATDSDWPAQTVTFSISGGADAAHFTINGSNELVFVTAPDFELPTDFFLDNVYQVQVTADDGNGGLDSLLISVTVLPIDDNVPVITSPNAADVAENTVAVMTVTAGDADLPAQSLDYSISGGADAASFAIDATTGSLKFRAAPDFESPADADGDNVYEVQVTAGDGDSSAPSQLIRVTVTPQNETPTAGDDRYVIDADTTLNIAAGGVLANDGDVDGDPLSAVLVNGPSHGTLALGADGSFSYSHNANFSGSDSFSYQANDGSMNSNVVAVTITVVDSPPPLVPSESGDSLSEPPVRPDPVSEVEIAPTPAAQVPAPPVQVAAASDAPRSAQKAGNSGAMPVAVQLATPAGSATLATADFAVSSIIDRDWGRAATSRSSDPGVQQWVVRSDLNFLLQPGALWQDLDELRDRIGLQGNTAAVTIGSVVASTVGLSVGYVVWLLRGGMLVSSLLTSMPAWRLIDPLPILESLDRGTHDGDEDGESLESMLRSAKEDSETEDDESL